MVQLNKYRYQIISNNQNQASLFILSVIPQSKNYQVKKEELNTSQLHDRERLKKLIPIKKIVLFNQPSE